MAGLDYTTTGDISEIGADPASLLIVAVLGMLGSYLEYDRDSAKLKIIWAGTTGGVIGALGTSETRFELAGAVFVGGLIAITAKAAVRKVDSDLPTEIPFFDG
ncbi:hypothetical protein [Natrinema halophilum]|uniref:Uncharacterized protein n=1 Tax=Natrinema halophilum TaxID=1699371 RepID=A0A7D5GH48_9EURY|nr:hypothetical protein [Natrinema halophilum]QLG48787.1 hypothetical protein HYG82_07970 [Natrinema halophilum]